MDVETIVEITSETEEKDPIYSHLISSGDDPRPPWVIVLEARVNGTPITAICGYIWIPSRDPEKYPLCPKCVEMAKFISELNNL